MLTFTDVSFSYEKKKIFDRFSFSLSDGEILAVMGASGFGKTTLLGLVAGLLKPQEGKIDSSFSRISYVFQEPRLFPWLTVEENLLAVLDKKDPNAKDTVQKALSDVALGDAAKLYPNELSGGMKSRAALARAMVYGGDLFLLDEPFAALDEGLRHALQQTLKDHLKERGAAAILVTHHADDASYLADRILQLG